jgi:hypothetical protein
MATSRTLSLALAVTADYWSGKPMNCIFIQYIKYCSQVIGYEIVVDANF